MREKLIELIGECKWWGSPEEMADHLLANGVIVLPKDGMLFHLEENEDGTWVGNKPIQDIVFKCGWGLVSLEWSFSLIGKTVFLTREEAEAALKEGQG